MNKKLGISVVFLCFLSFSSSGQWAYLKKVFAWWEGPSTPPHTRSFEGGRHYGSSVPAIKAVKQFPSSEKNALSPWELYLPVTRSEVEKKKFIPKPGSVPMVDEIGVSKHGSLLIGKNAVLTDVKSRIYPKYKTEDLKHTKSVKVFFSIPATPMEYKNIFKNFNNRFFHQSKSIVDKLIYDEQITFMKTEEDFRRMLLTSDSKQQIVLIGHNHNGKFVLPNGDAVSIEDLRLPLTNKPIVVLSCNARNYANELAPDYYLTYGDAVQLAMRIDQTITNLGSHKVYLQTVIDQLYSEKQLEKKKVLSVMIAGSGITIFLISNE